MTSLPLAEVDNAVALLDGNRLTIYVEGFTSGFGGQLKIWLRRASDDSPSFFVFAEPGNSGINPDAAPERVPTKAAAVFEGSFSRVHLHTAEGQRVLNPLLVEKGAAAATDEAAEDSSAPGWTAVHNFQPPGKPHLRVRGILMMPTPGHKLTLTKADPQGINPTILLLTLKVERPTGIVSQVIFPTPVAYDEDTTDHYRTVQIEPNHILVPVTEVALTTPIEVTGGGGNMPDPLRGGGNGGNPRP